VGGGVTLLVKAIGFNLHCRFAPLAFSTHRLATMLVTATSLLTQGIVAALSICCAAISYGSYSIGKCHWSVSFAQGLLVKPNGVGLAGCLFVTETSHQKEMFACLTAGACHLRPRVS
jgi:hypothetical protein